MIRPGVILGVARAEARLMRRLVRYWVFIVLATLLAAAGLANFYFIHRFFSWGSASAAMANPRFFVANFGSNFLFVFLIGLVFLGFDLRARDRKDRIIEVVDSLPCSNLELILGKFTGIVTACWVPAVLVTGLMMLAATLIKPSIEPWSAVAYLTFMTIPAFVFTLGLVFFLTLLLRNRLLAAVASIVVIVLAFFVSLWWIPFYVTPITDVTGGYSMEFPSDIIPSVVNARGLVQRTGYLLAGFAFLLFAAAIHPRKDDASRPVQAASGAALLMLGLVLCGTLVFSWKSEVESRATWRDAHAARSADPAPDVVAISGDVRLDSRRVDLDLSYRFRAPTDSGLSSALFTLNPGMQVEEARTASGQELSFTHENGLLEVQLSESLAPGEETSLQLVVQGRPDPNFAYITAALEPLTIKPTEAQILILGFDPLLLDRRIVALMPGVRWMPASGSEVGRGDPNLRPFDFYTVDLTVDVPEGWLVAGPGRRQEPQEPAEAKRTRFRFAPGAPLPDVALVAGRYVSRSTEIDDVLLEILIHPAHEANLDFFEDAAGEIRDWLAERLEEASNLGLDYPYDALTMVEIPNTLRGFAGGWRMDSTLIQPAMILTRESGFPTAWFKGGNRRFERARDREGGIARAKREGLERFFENDINGGNPFIAAARSFFGFQTSGEGPEGLPLDYVWESLSTELLTDNQGYFSVHFFDQDFGEEFMIAGQASQDPNRVGDSYADVLIHRIRSTNATWDTVNSVSLTELDPTEDPERAINVLSLKGGAMASSMLDGFGVEKTGHFLASLRSENLGESYDRDDVLAAGEAVDEDLEEWLDLWINTTELPGFTLGDVRYDRLADDEDGSMRYQLRVTLQNEEQPAGMARLEYRTEEQGESLRRDKGEPFQVPGEGAVEVGLVTASPLSALRVVPYLALNRDPFNVPLPPLDEEKFVDAESFVGVRDVDWSPPEDSSIIVDDLDRGFSVEEEGKRSFLRMGSKGAKKEDLDQGLPITSQFRVKTPTWSRMTYPDAYGKYRHTLAVVRAGEGKRNATFSVEIPASGQWELEYYLSPPSSRRGSRGKAGTFNLTVEDRSGSQPVTFDAEGGEVGWNSLGTFEIAGGEVRVMISDETDGDFVVADAIRWVPVTREAKAEQEPETSG
jgi:ABC-type transport system involved in multi-copper enzyme maturation permease subunit